MSNTHKILMVVPALIFVLACQLINRQDNDVKNVASTAQSVASQAVDLATQAAPLGTVIANPSALPNIVSTTFPGQNMLDPQGEPVSSWNDIPVMPQASAGQEVDGGYSYRISVKADEVGSFYADKLPALGWKESISMPSSGDATFLLYEKGNQVLTITVLSQGDHVIVILDTQ